MNTFHRSLLAAAALLAASSVAFAGDFPTKAKPSLLTDGYPTARCGIYFGVNTTGTSNGVTSSNAAVGEQIVQGGVGATVGYACPFGTSSFWFVEGMFDVQNLNGNTNGISIGGPAAFEQRFGVGSPLNSLLGSIIPGLGTSAISQIPALPGLPAGITAGPGQPYFFVALNERDISASVGLAQNREWLLQPGVGVGLLTPLSNKVTIDTFAEFDFQTNKICVGPAPVCSNIGQGVKVGVQAKY
jgi:hypothetical protein